MSCLLGLLAGLVVGMIAFCSSAVYKKPSDTRDPVIQEILQNVGIYRGAKDIYSHSMAAQVERPLYSGYYPHYVVLKTSYTNVLHPITLGLLLAWSLLRFQRDLH